MNIIDITDMNDAELDSLLDTADDETETVTVEPVELTDITDMSPAELDALLSGDR